MKVITSLFMMVLTLVPTSIHAQTPPHMDLGSAVAVVVANTADTVSTYRFLHNGSGCVEGNPRLGPHPSIAVLTSSTAINVGVILGVQYALVRLGRHARLEEFRFVQNVIRALGYTEAALATSVVIHNVHTCGF